MSHDWRCRSTVVIAASVISLMLCATAGAASFTSPKRVTSAAAHATVNCGSNGALCTEVYDSESVFGHDHYVGHDEPSVLFYSDVPGSGNRARYQLTIPREGSGSSRPTYNFQLHPAFWFGMAMCDTQSYPEQLKRCTPDSDTNIVDPATSAKHAGTAFMEMQFYPPGWAPFQDPGGVSCSATQWCAALNIDSLSQNPVNGGVLNDTCLAKIGSPEYVNFAFITRSGVPQAPPNPVDATGATYTPNPTKDLMMNAGDDITVSMGDTSAGLRIELVDNTTHRSGFMVASASNGFGQVRYAPNPSTSCQNLPYDFHPMYSTSSPQTRVPWAAHTYNVAYSDEIGHFDYCSRVTSNLGCSGTEGRGKNSEPSDGDDLFCLPGGLAFLYKISGCADSNVPGFDGTSYLADWPNGKPNAPSPIEFTSPLTGTSYNVNYSRSAFETDLPRVEQGIAGCDPLHDRGCTLLPTTDDGTPAQFYPFFSTTNVGGHCRWVEGNDIPGVTVNDFGRNLQYGTYDTGVDYTGAGGAPFAKADDFRQIFFNNVCPAS